VASSTPFEATRMGRVLEEELPPTAVCGTRAQPTRVAEKRNPRDETNEEGVPVARTRRKAHKSAPENQMPRYYKPH